MSCGIDNYKVNDIVNNFKLLNYDEKKAFIHRVFSFHLLTVSDLDNRFALISMLNALFRAYKLKHPDEKMDIFISKLLKDQMNSIDKEWIETFLPFAEEIAQNCDSINTYGLKSAVDFKKEICKILDFVLPF